MGCREGKRNKPGDERFKGEKQRDFRVPKRWKENVQNPMSEKIIHLKKCSVSTQEPGDAKEKTTRFTCPKTLERKMCKFL